MSYFSVLPSELISEIFILLPDDSNLVELSEIPEFHKVLSDGKHWNIKFRTQFPKVNWSLIPKIDYTIISISYYDLIHKNLSRNYHKLVNYLDHATNSIFLDLSVDSERFFGVSPKDLTDEQLGSITNYMPIFLQFKPMHNLTDSRVLTMDFTENFSIKYRTDIYKTYDKYYTDFYSDIQLYIYYNLFKIVLFKRSQSIKLEIKLTNIQSVFNLLFHLLYNGSPYIQI